VAVHPKSSDIENRGAAAAVAEDWASGSSCFRRRSETEVTCFDHHKRNHQNGLESSGSLALWIDAARALKARCTAPK
jgi:hypothetical protein